MNNIEKEELDEFLQWKKDNGKFEYKLTDIYVNDNGEIKTEKKIAMIIKFFVSWDINCICCIIHKYYSF